MEVKLDIYLKFPTDVDTDKNFQKLRKYMTCTEHLEEVFGIEFSCGDGKFMSDFWDWPTPDSMACNTSNEVLEFYDGKVCLKTPPRFFKTKKLLEADKNHRFTIKYYEKQESVRYYLNGKETNSEFIN